MNLVLRWDSPEGDTNDLLYTAECKTSVRMCHVGCVNISTHECDFSSLSTSLSVYGSYIARVRAQRGAESSSWVESKPITLESDTVIGSPNVLLFSNGATIEIAIKEPAFAISDFRSVYSTATYNITYWKDGQNKKARSISSDRRNRMFLNDLEPWSKYCVQVQIIAEGNTKPSKLSSPVCESTTSVRTELPPPQNVALITLNTNYTLKWDWDETTSKSRDVSFSAEYMPIYKLKSKIIHNWSVACDNSPSKSCDFTGCNLHYLGSYMLRVRTNENSSHSDWVEKEFCPDKHAAIGPPSKVELAPAENNLDVYISPPLTSSNLSMKAKLSKLYYYIVYWEHGVDKQVLQPQIVNSNSNMVTLPDLKPWTWYCVRVQSRSDIPNKISKFDFPHCIQTEGIIPWWQTSLYFLGSLMIGGSTVLLLVFILFSCYKTFNATFYPLIQLPPFFQKSHLDGLGSDIPCLLSMESEAEGFCDKVTICAKPMECHSPSSKVPPMSPLCLEAASSGRNSHQDRRRIRDSGVNATEGRKCQQQQQQQLNNSQSSSDDFDLVKMHNLTPGHNSQFGITVEGVIDLCV
ncbi:interferon alpha/beta receptor 1b-like isoform X2 [Phycodurus eques]|nr:interferon alpha/beta receptor 1b-like isoform X2 [Phycodurus eques]XP_061548979.1 interferon alpha/beta receptor 1b-like isoform X2 [Phycodurus eques]